MIRKQFGDSIRKRRENLKISQENFALNIKMDRTYYSSVENGKRNISLINIEKIANGFNISISELFEDIKYNPKNEVNEK